MHKWKFINKIYTYDGSFEGLLTIVFDSYINKTLPYNITSDTSCINLLYETIYIKTDEIKAKRILEGCVKNISYHALSNSYHTFLSNNPKKELLIVQYLLLGFSIGNKIDHLLSNEIVLEIEKIHKRVFGEVHRLMGLARFIEIDKNIFYCKIHPDNNIIELLAHHFIRRFPTRKFNDT